MVAKKEGYYRAPDIYLPTLLTDTEILGGLYNLEMQSLTTHLTSFRTAKLVIC